MQDRLSRIKRTAEKIKSENCHCAMELDVPVDWAQIEEKRERWKDRIFSSRH